MSPAARVQEFLSLLAAADHRVAPGSSVLDFGCGSGSMVRAFLTEGFDAYGADFASAISESGERIRPLAEPYGLPFEDNSFDCVVSEQVFEHVQDYETALTEIRRVLRPGGAGLHLFPPRYSLRECHVLVPFATVIQSRPWLWLWALAGVRNQFQVGKRPREVVALNYHFLRNHTTYLTRSQVLQEARAVFPSARLIEQELLASRPTLQARLLTTLTRRAPIVATVFAETRGRALLTV